VDARYCPNFHRTVELIGRRWTGAILLVMQGGALDRFAAIRNAVPGLSDRLLVERLRELEAEGIVARTEDARGIRYRLTGKGIALLPVIAALSEWTQDWLEPEPETKAAS
jgi:DNA-binding HxlR family transcriptional regulator